MWLSTARFEPFLTAAGGNHISAVGLYDWHSETAAACFEMLHHFEIVVRNAIDRVLGEGQPQDPIKDTWLMDFDTLQPDGVKQVILAVERLDRGKGITRSRVAHHDCLLNQDIEQRADDMLTITGWIDPNAQRWLRERSRVHTLLAARP